ncbi:MAG: hypothetical protein MZU97_05705 [Bacillus subtilis]|nr:hypothetical protein [Bacillus subtilis]
MTGNERRLQRRAQSKKAHLIRYLWMFIAATAAVLGADTLLASPDVSAHIEASALTNAVIYRLDVAVIDSSQFARPLRLVIESQFGDQSREIPCGASEGAFEGLRPNTLYTLRVVVDQGFGDQSIAKTTVRTQNALSGGLTVFFDSIDYGHGEELVTIGIDALWNDPLNEIIDLRILYAVVMPSAFDKAMFDDPLVFETAPLELANPTLMLGPYFNSGQMLLLLFEASTPSGTHRLETRVVEFPLAVYASLYVQNAGPATLDIAVYAALPDGIDATFDVELWNGSDARRDAAVDGIRRTQRKWSGQHQIQSTRKNNPLFRRFNSDVSQPHNRLDAPRRRPNNRGLDDARVHRNDCKTHRRRSIAIHSSPR